MTFHDRRFRRSTPCSRRKRRASTRLTTGARTVARSALEAPARSRSRTAPSRRRDRAGEQHRRECPELHLALQHPERDGEDERDQREHREERRGHEAHVRQESDERRDRRQAQGDDDRERSEDADGGEREGVSGARPAPRSSAVRFATTVCSVFSGTDITSSTASNDESAPYSPGPSERLTIRWNA